MCGRVCISIIAVFLFLFATEPRASLHVDVTRGNAHSMEVALAPLYSSSNLERNISNNCFEVIRSNLVSAGNFNVRIEVSPLWVTATGIPAPDAWTDLSSDVLLTGSVQELQNGRLKLRLFIWDVSSRKELSGKSFNFGMENWRIAAHTVSDHIFSRLTGEKGFFDSRVVYLTESSSGSREIAIMDQDGANNTYLSLDNAKGELAAARFSPDTTHIAYILNSGDNNSKVVLQSLDNATSTELVNLEGLGVSLSFSPDGKNILISCSRDGRDNLYSYNVKDKTITQLTDDHHAHTSASYSPDGKSVTFASDKSGAMHIYVMNEDGSNIKKISSGSGGYRSPSWSPRGDLIAFTKVKGKNSYVGVMRPDGSRERIVASGEDILGSTSWAPNGRTLLFTRQQKVPSSEQKTELVMVNTTGVESRVIEVQGGVLDAHWSPLLHD